MSQGAISVARFNTQAKMPSCPISYWLALTYVLEATWIVPSYYYHAILKNLSLTYENYPFDTVLRCTENHEALSCKTLGVLQWL